MNAQTKVQADTLASAMARAFGAIEAATKGAENAAFKNGGKVSKYADINAVIDAIKPALIEHGLFFTQHPVPHDRGVQVETFLHHAGGESMSLGSLFVPADKQNAQGFGSALTYARRYALVTAFGVPVEDDDGNAAVKAVQGHSSERAVSPAPPTINGEQITRLQLLIEANKMTPVQFCRSMGCSEVHALPAERFNEAVERLEDRLAKLAKQETNQQAKADA